MTLMNFEHTPTKRVKTPTKSTYFTSSPTNTDTNAKDDQKEQIWQFPESPLSKRSTGNRTLKADVEGKREDNSIEPIVRSPHFEVETDGITSRSTKMPTAETSTSSMYFVDPTALVSPNSSYLQTAQVGVKGKLKRKQRASTNDTISLSKRRLNLVPAAQHSTEVCLKAVQVDIPPTPYIPTHEDWMNLAERGLQESPAVQAAVKAVRLRKLELLEDAKKTRSNDESVLNQELSAMSTAWDCGIAGIVHASASGNGLSVTQPFLKLETTSESSTNSSKPSARLPSCLDRSHSPKSGHLDSVGATPSSATPPDYAHLIQQDLKRNPWMLLIATMFLNKLVSVLKSEVYHLFVLISKLPLS
jgi:hypothetical protein